MKNTKFDAEFYVRNYLDVKETNLTPQEHYNKYGVILGRSKNKEEFIYKKKLISDKELVRQYEAKELSLLYSENFSLYNPRAGDPKVSLIITNYNNGNYLEQSLNSALSQKDVDLEIIVIDDGSNDMSLNILNTFKSNKKIKILPLIRNFGCYYARNIGISLAKGDYISFLDSDDIMHPDRLRIQIDSMIFDSKILMSTSKIRRWTENYENSLSELKDGEVTAVFKKSVFESIGFFDTVKYGADEEFRKRLDRVFGIDCVLKLEKELYYARTVGSSLTASGRNAIFSVENGQLKFKKSESRSFYAKSFRSWHKQFKETKDKSGLYVKFPQVNREIVLHDPKQNASPFMNQKIIGCMATFPAREEVLKKTILSILDQLDELYIYLNDYKDIPVFLDHPKITCYLGRKEVGDLRDNGKFYKLSELEGYILTLDDDIFYPHDYVRWMLHYIETFNRSIVVGVHGVIYPEEKKGYMQDRTVLHFKEAAQGSLVDSLGTGTVAFHSSLIPFGLNVFKTKGVCDLWFAKACHINDIPLLAVPRNKNWLKPAEYEGVNLFSEAKKTKALHDKLYHENLYNVIAQKSIRDKFQNLILSLVPNISLCLAEFGFDNSTSEVDTSLGFRPYELNRINNNIEKDFNASVRFHVVVNGWNCAEYVQPCLRSLSNQQLGDFSVEFTIVDDGSDDKTLEELINNNFLPTARIVKNAINMGPAFTRDSVIRNIVDPEVVVVLVDLDDELFSESLKTVAKIYKNNPECMMTLGNWVNQNGRPNPLPFYEDNIIESQSVREVEKFHAAPLRTFKRKLYDAVNIDDLKGPDGEWLQTCTDVAIMYPLLDQCRSKNVVFIEKYLYMYNEKTSFGTLSRFGKPYKNERLTWLKGKSKKNRYSAT